MVETVTPSAYGVGQSIRFLRDGYERNERGHLRAVKVSLYGRIEKINQRMRGVKLEAIAIVIHEHGTAYVNLDAEKSVKAVDELKKPKRLCHNVNRLRGGLNDGTIPEFTN